jgi:hypothetical protein
MPLRNAFVPIPDIIQIPEKSSSDSCTKYATHIAPLLVRDAACGGQLCAAYKQNRRTRRCARGYGGLEEFALSDAEHSGLRNALICGFVAK